MDEPDLQAEYLGSQHEWDDLAEDLARTTAAGIASAADTETVGCDPEEETPVGNARVLIWSVAVADGPEMPRGYRKARGYVLPWQAAFHEGLAKWLAGRFGRVWTFNGRYDRHSFANLGVDTSGFVDCLDYLRILDPGQDSYSLKSCIPRYLGYNPVGTFKKVFSVEQTKTVVKKNRICSWDPTHEIEGNRKKCEICRSLIEVHFVEEERKMPDRKVSLQEAVGLAYDMKITPGEHPLWRRTVLYSAGDAIGNAEIADLLPQMKSCKLPAKIPQLS